jgi:hypothetical protein
MNIAVCFTGFLRNLNYIEGIKHISSILSPNLRSLTIYYSCPTKIEETDAECFDKEYVLSLFKNQETNKIKVNISFRDYDKSVFVEKSQSLGLPYITSANYHSYRIISNINAFSETAKMVDNNDTFNFIIFTRLDFIKTIISVREIFDNNLILKNEAYLWRTIPYISGINDYHAEDRFFICSNECIEIIKGAYTKLNEIKLSEDKFCAEIFFGALFNLHKNIYKHYLYNLQVSHQFNAYTTSRVQMKYTKEFLDKM